MKKKKTLAAGEKAALLVAASGTCYRPGCGTPLIVNRDEHQVVNYEVAHIRDELPPVDDSSDVGWRYWPADDLSQDDRNRFDNLLLLCAPCHKLVDRINPRSFSVAGLHTWKGGAEGANRVRLAEALSEIRADEILDLVVAALATSPSLHLSIPTTTSPDPLSFAARQTVHTGRSAELDDLRRFLEMPETFAWWVVAGDAGSGKSRLALELCLTAPSNWHAGFLRESNQDALIAHVPEQPTLVVVDYAAARSAWLGEALHDLAARLFATGPRMRLLVLERSAEPGWFAAATRIHRHHESRLILSHQYAEPLQLGGLRDQDLAEIIRSVAVQKGSVPTSTDVEDLVDRARTIDPQCRPLFAIITALEWLDGGDGQARDEVLRHTLARRSAQAREDSAAADTRRRASVLDVTATAIGGIEASEYSGLPSAAPAVGGLQLPWLDELDAHDLDARLGGVQPDILGELHVLDSLSLPGIAGALTSDSLLVAWRYSPARYAAFVERAARDHPLHDRLADLLAVELTTQAERDTWFRLAPSVVRYLRSASNPHVRRIQSLLEAKSTGEDHELESAAQLNFNHGNLFLSDGDTGAANHLYSDILATARPRWEVHSSCLTNRGVTWMTLGEMGRAEDDFNLVIESPFSSDESKACCLNNRADIRADEGELLASIADRTAVLALNETSYNRRFIALVRRARSRWQLGERHSALADIWTILDTPDIVVEQKMAARLTRAEWYLDREDSGRAEVDLRAVIASHRNFPEVEATARGMLSAPGTQQ